MNSNNQPVAGSIVALVTPMRADGSLDYDSLQRLVDFHIEQGTDAIATMGTTGESATLSIEEHLQVVQSVVDHCNGRIPVIAGSGANSTNEAMELTLAAKDLGVDACLLVVPYYNKPTQEGLYRHYMSIADSVDVPQILYNVPGRTITDLSNEVALRLAHHDNIIGIKDATADMSRGQELINESPAGFGVFSGDDLTACELMLRGAKGNISVTANVAPNNMSSLCRLAIAGDRAAAEALQAELTPLHKLLFVESNPIPVKWAAAEMGLIPEGIRLPLTQLSEAHREPLRQAMSVFALIP